VFEVLPLNHVIIALNICQGVLMEHFTVKHIIELLNNQHMTSYELVELYLKRIKEIDPLLNSVSELNVHALDEAKKLDLERSLKGPRSLLHGIPILLKDNINTQDGMRTTASSFALSDLYAPYEATIVKKLKQAGIIILGKANLSEFAYFMSYDKMPSGYGSLNGQVKSPYHENIDPLGSSTGSAVSVAANLIPFSVGTETNGSLMAPAFMNSIVAIKPTLGLVSRHGIIPISETQDTAGPMAKTVMDCAYLLDVLKGSDPHDAYTKDANAKQKTYADADQIDVKGMSVGFLRFNKYKYNELDLEVLNEAFDKLQSIGINVRWYDFEAVTIPNDQTLLYEFKHSLNAYLNSVTGYTKMKSLEDIIKFNEENKERCLKYGQSILTAAQKTSGTLNDSNYLKLRKEFLLEARKYDDLLDTENLDALISTKWLSYAPVYGNPSICVPGRKLVDDKPKSLIFVGRKWDEKRLIAIAHAYEKLTNHRIAPSL
jgi:amidase